jgi:hypothetical protein
MESYSSGCKTNAMVYTTVSQTLGKQQSASYAVRAHADHTQKCMQVNRRNIIPVVKVTTTTFFLHINLEHFLK